MDEFFESAIRSSGDLAGVFEFDVDISFFYLYAIDATQNHIINDSIRICLGTPNFDKSDIDISWGEKEQWVGLFIKKVLWAVFECDGNRGKFGGNYQKNAIADIPNYIVKKFKSIPTMLN